MIRSRLLTGLAGAAVLIAGITVLSRVLGLARWAVQSGAVGATPTGTAYATANLVPNVLFEVVAGGALAGAVIPLLAGPIARGMTRDVDRTASALLTWALAVMLPVSVLVAVLARPVVGLLIGSSRPGADPELTAATVDLAAHLLVIFAPQVALYAVGVVLTGVLQAKQRFLWPAAAPIASSLVVMASYVVFRGLAGKAVNDPASLTPEAVAWLGWGTTAGVAAMTLPLLVPVVRSGVRLRPTVRFPPGVARRARGLAAAGLGGVLAQQVSVVVVAWLANERGAAGGTLNLYQYSQAVYFLPYAVLAVPLATAVFPRLAEHVASGDRARYSGLVSLSTRAVIVVGFLGAAALAAVAPAVADVFAGIDASGDVDEVAAMGPALAVLAPGLVGYALVFQVSRVLFALERGRTAVATVATAWLSVVVASLVAVQLLAPEGGDGPATLLGLALGNTVGMVVGGVVLLAAVRRVAGVESFTGVLRTAAVAATGAAVGALLGRGVVDLLGVTPVVRGLLGASVAGVVLLAVTWLLDRGTLVGVLRDRAAPGPADPRQPSPTQEDRHE